LSIYQCGTAIAAGDANITLENVLFSNCATAVSDSYAMTGFSTTSANSHRSACSANPFSYYERMLMISDITMEIGIESKLIGFVPFPLTTPSLLSSYLPADATIHLTIYDDWGRQKYKILQ